MDDEQTYKLGCLIDFNVRSLSESLAWDIQLLDSRVNLFIHYSLAAKANKTQSLVFPEF